MEQVLYSFICSVTLLMCPGIVYGAAFSDINGDPDEKKPLLGATHRESVRFKLTQVQHPRGQMPYAIDCDLEVDGVDPYVRESYRVLRRKQITEKGLPWVLLAIYSWGPTQVLFKPDDLPKIQCHDLCSILKFMQEDKSLLPLINEDEVWRTLCRIYTERIGLFRAGHFQTFIFNHKGEVLSDYTISDDNDTALAALLRCSVLHDTEARAMIKGLWQLPDLENPHI